jgi:hypothetical protein
VWISPFPPYAYVRALFIVLDLEQIPLIEKSRRATQICGHHPWGYLNDETSFQPEAGECYNEALSAVKGKIIFNSSAGPGWYADARRDIIRNTED